MKIPQTRWSIWQIPYALQGDLPRPIGASGQRDAILNLNEPFGTASLWTIFAKAPDFYISKEVNSWIT